MRSLCIALFALAVSAVPQPAFAGAGSFTIVNGTGADIAALSIRRVGTSDWRSLGATARSGGRSPVSFSDPDCAFDLRANLAGGAVVTWGGVNLCEASALTLRRSASGEAWVDYD